MARKRKKYDNNDNTSTAIESSPEYNFKTFVSAIKSPLGFKAPVLKSLYLLLVHLSSNGKRSSVTSHDLIYVDGSKIAFGDIHELSNLLFEVLTRRFEQFMSAICESSGRTGLEEVSCQLDLVGAAEIVNLLLRCCLVLLNFSEYDQNLSLEKGQVLVKILRQLQLQDVVNRTEKKAFCFEKSSNTFTRGEDGCSVCTEDFTFFLRTSERSNSYHFYVSGMLEVFLDELLIHRVVRESFVRIDSVTPSGEMILVEIICTHFFLSFSDDQAFEDFLSRLFCLHAEEHAYSFRAPELSPGAAVSLYLSPFMMSAPKYMQAHLISLVAEATNTEMVIKSLKPDRRLTNFFLYILERSIFWYLNICNLQLDSCSRSARSSAESTKFPETVYSSFEARTLPDTKVKVDSLISKLDYSPCMNLHHITTTMKSDLVSSGMRFMKDIQTSFDLSCQDEILAVLSYLIHRASGSFADAADLTENKGLQDIYLAASVLKLIGTSMLQAIWSLTNRDDLCHPTTLKDLCLCEEYNSILSIITCFKDLDVSHPIQQVLKDLMSSSSTKHEDSKMMFLHFSGLLSLSFACGLDCLVKGCLLIITALLNLFVLEEGNLDIFQFMLDRTGNSFSSSPDVEFQETIVNQSSSLVVASNFQKTRNLHLSAKDTEEMCNGEAFLRCTLKKNERLSDQEDIIDFIECAPGKDYAAWMKNREKFRKWQLEKRAVIRWKKKIKSLKTIKGKKH